MGKHDGVPVRGGEGRGSVEHVSSEVLVNFAVKGEIVHIYILVSKSEPGAGEQKFVEGLQL